MANFNFPDRIVDDPSPPSLQCTEVGFGAIDLNADPDCGSGVDDLCSPSPQFMELGSGAIAGTIDLNVDPDYGSPPRCVELGFGASAGIIDLNVDPDCGLGVGDPCPPSLQCTELGFAAGAGIIDLNVDPDCGSPPRCVERFDLNTEVSDSDFDLNAEISDSDFRDFFVGWRSPASTSIEFSRARFSIVEGLEVGKIDSYFGLEGQIIAVGDERESDEEASDQMQDVTLFSCLDCIELLRRDDREGVVDKYEPYEVLSGQFTDDESAFSEIPLTANSAVESLSSVFLPQEEITEHDVQYTHGTLVGERPGLFPCSHQYQEGCMVLWLRVCNRCSLCGHVLPMDNLEYGLWRE